MKYYQEISLLPNAEITPYFIWQKLYQQIHLALVENRNEENASMVGVSFPEYNADEFLLGTKLRLFAEDEQSLKDMQCEKWLNRLRDYVHLKPIEPVPERLMGHACFKHIKLKGNKEKLARRRVKRKGETLQQALAYFADYEEQCSKLPYINMTSQTNGHRFRLFIEKQAMEQPQTGLYLCYGLSNTTTVPLF
ncbi:MAG: type I-F CRISPR-associated endoribonuclease Cas6/Csy4 [Thermodesulfobacteriota bacterium]|nr:type I-F CRISPR-associated endoribonuclease Cas6/Csy4 [Thermodesulfobacteriota bacterium]